MAKHTPGKWEVEVIGVHQFIVKNNKTIAKTPWDISNQEENEANARLIASAPELLEACKEAFTYLDKPHTSKFGNVEIIDLLNKAITKALSHIPV
uniref:Uncharacterized protein n=1 Tax=viral metagenome TaxID=1070528 RepID=A0A6M3LRI8_9ZZZZ